MTRSLPEWIGRSDDTAIPPRVKARVVGRQDGICACGCGVKLGLAGERIDFDHALALINGGENREANIQALRAPCHALKTRQDVATKAKSARVRKKHLGLHQPKATLPGGRTSKFKRKIGGGVVLREED